ncbi:arrestin domain-containing protein 17-like isoform X2 [Vespula maculifrons]|uniref:Arrestin domain-containing protein 17-like isoform X2 n=1 Tax=Vespula maculifrons TaxID=7453 RepID=A0ABD2AN67_VESMC
MVDIPSKLNWKTKSTFIVVTPFDLNTVSHRCVRIKKSNSRYVPGQSIMIEVFTILKSSSYNVTKIYTELEFKILMIYNEQPVS